MEKLEHTQRYLQIAFNGDLSIVRKVLPQIQYDSRIMIEAGTPFIKREGMRGLNMICRIWPGIVVADLKTNDGAQEEVEMAAAAGANAATVLGSCPTETLNLFVSHCSRLGIISMIDMIGVDEVLDVMRPLKKPPDVVVIHRGRDEENTRGKVIKYKQINRIRSKFDVFISAAGGVDERESRSAIFNGANIVVVNIVRPGEEWQGISSQDDVGRIIKSYMITLGN
ncbi:MAG: hypothetical protein JEZ06_20155 [Anaerolineaceae bacterium]|nr:hypothetical protein [Anaerolineaceae bacterium]